MGRITLSDEALGMLAGVPGPVEVCDASGTVRGRFIPETEEEQLVRWARSHFDLKEANRRLAEGNFISNEEAVRRFNEAVEKHR
ncbi:MAG: hypothetical protein K2W96_13235 [Gemmataceae bacterium]|nr:hypothetical protein [Gemmataceae bacterium]